MAAFIFMMLLPRTIGFLFPENAPIAYHFEVLDYLAIGVGLEKLANLEPEIQKSIEEIKNIEYKKVNGRSLQLDIYKPRDLKKPAPLLVFVHGGGWLEVGGDVAVAVHLDLRQEQAGAEPFA